MTQTVYEMSGLSIVTWHTNKDFLSYIPRELQEHDVVLALPQAVHCRTIKPLYHFSTKSILYQHERPRGYLEPTDWSGMDVVSRHHFLPFEKGLVYEFSRPHSPQTSEFKTSYFTPNEIGAPFLITLCRPGKEEENTTLLNYFLQPGKHPSNLQEETNSKLVHMDQVIEHFSLPDFRTRDEHKVHKYKFFRHQFLYTMLNTEEDHMIFPYWFQLEMVSLCQRIEFGIFYRRIMEGYIKGFETRRQMQFRFLEMYVHLVQKDQHLSTDLLRSRWEKAKLPLMKGRKADPSDTQSVSRMTVEDVITGLHLLKKMVGCEDKVAG